MYPIMASAAASFGDFFLVLPTEVVSEAFHFFDTTDTVVSNYTSRGICRHKIWLSHI